MKKKTKRYCVAYAVIPSHIEDYAILPEDISSYSQCKMIKNEYMKFHGIKAKIIKVEVCELQASKKKSIIKK